MRSSRVIAEGGMGIVYRARDHVLERNVAIKTLHTNLLGNLNIRRRFLREASVLMTTWSHPNVAMLFDTVSHDDILAIVMELGGRTHPARSHLVVEGPHAVGRDRPDCPRLPRCTPGGPRPSRGCTAM